MTEPTQHPTGYDLSYPRLDFGNTSSRIYPILYLLTRRGVDVPNFSRFAATGRRLRKMPVHASALKGPA